MCRILPENQEITDQTYNNHISNQKKYPRKTEKNHEANPTQLNKNHTSKNGNARKWDKIHKTNPTQPNKKIGFSSYFTPIIIVEQMRVFKVFQEKWGMLKFW